jgi:hypothetical protein
MSNTDSTTREWPQNYKLVPGKSQCGIGMGGAHVGGEYVVGVGVSGDGGQNCEDKQKQKLQRFQPQVKAHAGQRINLSC